MNKEKDTAIGCGLAVALAILLFAGAALLWAVMHVRDNAEGYCAANPPRRVWTVERVS